MINKNKIQDPLNELTLPNFSRLGINHHSPTSASMPSGIYLFRYVFCTQEERRLFKGNTGSNMAAGVAVNNALQNYYSDTIYKFHPLTKKLAPVKHEKVSKESAIQDALEKFKEYEPVDDKDREKYEHYIETIPSTITHGFFALDSVNTAKGKNITAEASINHIDKRLSLPIVGRTDCHYLTDFHNLDLNEKEQSFSDGAAPVAPFLSVQEWKTSWSKAMKIKKDGSRSFAKARLPSIPNRIHLQQLAFYCESLKPKNPMLIYIAENGFQIFNKNNCADLEPQNLKNYYEQLVQVCIRRERLLSRYSHLNDIDRIKEELIKDVDPEFDHNFYWNIGYEFLTKAKKLWSFI